MNEFAYIRNILNDLQERFERKYSPNDCHLKRELLLLGQFPKLLIKKKVIGFDYNVGALPVLRMLNDCNIVGISEYLSCRYDGAEVQGIIADLMDLENMHQVLSEVIMSARSSEIIDTQFQECFRQYILDVITRPQLIRHDFISKLEAHLDQDVFRDMIVLRFIDEVLVSEHRMQVEITDVISNQKSWNAQYSDQSLKMLSQILRHISINHSEPIAKTLTKEFNSNAHTNWFLMLLITRLVNHNSAGLEELKQFLKASFKKFIEANNVDDLFKMIIVARQLFHYTPNAAFSYKLWLKQTIGEMSYQLKSQPKFTQVLEALQNMIFFETDLEVLEIHAQTSIASPRGTNHLVLEYKQQLKTRIASLKDPDSFMDLT